MEGISCDILVSIMVNQELSLATIAYQRCKNSMVSWPKCLQQCL